MSLNGSHHVGDSGHIADHIAIDNVLATLAGQNIAYAATIAPDLRSGAVVKVGTLTGSLAVAAPLHATMGATITLLFYQDATGGRVVTWDASFRSPAPVDTTPSSVTVSSFVYDGSQWL